MDEDLKKVVKTKVISPEELEHYREKYEADKKNNYLSQEAKEDRIGSYYSMVSHRDSEDEERYKLYIKENDRDPIIYRLKYYDILKHEANNAVKAMQLYVLEKTIKMVYRKELKDHPELEELLHKIKNAKAYYSYKMFF